RIGTPGTHQPNPEVHARAKDLAAQHGGSVLITDDPVAAVSGSDAVATDTWVSMGRETEKSERQGQTSPFLRFQVNAELMAHADSDAVFLHCLPACRGYGVSAEVIDGPQSVAWDESENRLHAQKAVLAWLVEQHRAGESP